MKRIIQGVPKKLLPVVYANLGLVVLQFAYAAIRLPYVNSEVPFWMTMPWGDLQLASKNYLYLLPVLSLLAVLLGSWYAAGVKNKLFRYGEVALSYVFTIANVLLAYSLARIVHVASVPFDPIVRPEYLQIALPLICAFLVVYLLAPKLIDKFKEMGIVTDPTVHQHPGMLLTKPAARGGGVIFTLGLLVTSLFFIKLSPLTIGIFVSVILAMILGFMDDVQNTRPLSKLKKLENPVLRLILQAAVALPMIFGGTLVSSINNPFNGLMHFDTWTITLGGMAFAPLAIFVTIIWVVWIMNLLSWSNGVDGQYSGIVGIAGLMIATITLRLLPFDPSQKEMVELAAIVAGAGLGLLPYSWHPSKIMWGFGATASGVVLAALSVVSQAKIATSFILLTVPFLDAAITVTRRVLAGHSPFRGDRGHLHHLLLRRGWSIEQVAVFYWTSTMLFGLAGVYAADKDPILTAMTGAGIVAVFIIILNMSAKEKSTPHANDAPHSLP